MSIQALFLIVLVLGFILGVLAQQLVSYAQDWIRHTSLARERAMRAHPAGGRGNLHVGTTHVPASRGRDELLDRLDGYEEWGIILGPQPEDYPPVDDRTEMPPGWVGFDEPLPGWLELPVDKP